LKIKTFTVENFCSIKKAKDLPIYNLSILVGPNNEGKSNILRALVLALNNIVYYDRERIVTLTLTERRRLREDRVITYNWNRDYPLELQNYKPNGTSNFIIEFELDKREKHYLFLSTKHKLTGNLKVKMSLGNNNGSKTRTISVTDGLNQNTKFPVSPTFKFIAKRLSVQYIGTIRTAGTTTEVIEEIISNEISLLRKKKEYKIALNQLDRIEKPVLEKVSNSITNSVSGFLPNVTEINIDTEERIRRYRRRIPCNIIVDDGIKTDLEFKGDGIKSLIAISVIHYIAQQKALGKNIILAIEEPESHLHPDAIHRIRDVLEDISKDNQVIISTHSPLLINRSNIKKNLLVYESQSKVANNIAEIRNQLGVLISDNLISAKLVILVEGNEDIKILKPWVCHFSGKIKKAINDGEIIFDHLNGSANLSYKISQWNGLLCDVIVFLDGDNEGKNAYRVAEEKKLIKSRDVFFTNVQGMNESEIEDFITINTYKSEIESEFGVSLKGNIFRNKKKKWSDRVKDTFKSQGKIFEDKTKQEIKQIVSKRVSETGCSDSLKNSCMNCIKAFVDRIEEYISVNE